MTEQDAGLDTLGEIISRQKAMAHGICTEIDLHNGEHSSYLRLRNIRFISNSYCHKLEILDDIGDAMDANNDRLARNSRNIAVISRKDSSCCKFVDV